MIRATDDTYPVLCLQAVGILTRAELERAQGVYVRSYRRGQRLICISDARQANHEASQRKLLAEWAADVLKGERGLCAGNVVLLASALQRGALTAMNWLSPPPIPQLVAADGRTAVEAARRIAQRENMSVAEGTWDEVRNWFDGRDSLVQRP